MLTIKLNLVNRVTHFRSDRISCAVSVNVQCVAENRSSNFNIMFAKSSFSRRKLDRHFVVNTSILGRPVHVEDIRVREWVAIGGRERSIARFTFASWYIARKERKEPTVLWPLIALSTIPATHSKLPSPRDCATTKEGRSRVSRVSMRDILKRHTRVALHRSTVLVKFHYDRVINIRKIDVNVNHLWRAYEC